MRTHVWKKATDLSYDDFIKHTNILKEKALVEEKEGKYVLTEKGRITYSKLKDFFPALMWRIFTSGEIHLYWKIIDKLKSG